METETVTETPKKRPGNAAALTEYRRKVAAGEIVPKAPRRKVIATDRWGRPRDSQKGRVYSAESFLPDRDPDGKLGRAVDNRTRRGGWAGQTYPDISLAQAFVDDLTRARWFQSRWGQVRIEVIPGNGNNATYRGRVMLTGSGRLDPSLIVHEVAHWLSSKSSRAGHGPEFAATLLVLVEGYWGAEVARQLRASYVKHNVRYRSGMASVPKPGAKTVITKSARAKKEREAKEARIRQLVGSREKRELAAEVIRAMVATGHFGERGSRAYGHALVTAKLVEKVEAVPKAASR